MNPEIWRPLIDAADVVSFDVFDTLLLRHHYQPTDVFTELPQYRLPVSPRLQRIAAERLSRWKNRHQEDITLSDIYSLLPGKADDEITEEMRSVHINPDVEPMLSYALAMGKKIVAVSDMYLPRETVTALIKNAGLQGISQIFVSSDLGKTKSSGRLYQHVCHTLGVPPEKVLHVGDNLWSDHQQAKRQGLKSLHIPTRKQRFENQNVLNPRLLKILSNRSRPIHSLMLGLYRDRFHQLQSDHDYWYIFGYTTLGPIVNAFAEWIKCQADKKKLNRIFFLARDGALPQKVFSLRYPSYKSHYTYASRRLFLLPSLVDTADENLIDGLCGGLPGTQADEYWLRLGIDSTAATSLLRKYFAPNAVILSPADHLRLRAFFRELVPLLRQKAMQERETLQSYCRSIGLDGPDSGLLVDIGWRASSQRYLETALPELKKTAGAYFGLEADAYDNGNMDAFFFQAGSPAIHRHLAMHCVELVELMFSAETPSVRCLTQESESIFLPVYEPCSDAENTRSRIVTTLHRAALDFTQDLLRLQEKGYDTHLNARDVQQLLSPVMLYPSPADIAHIGSVPHALGLGNSRYESLLPPELPSSPGVLLKQLIGSSRGRLYWPRGLTRGIAHQYGFLSGLKARCVISLYFLALQVRHVVYTCIKR